MLADLLTDLLAVLLTDLLAASVPLLRGADLLKGINRGDDREAFIRFSGAQSDHTESASLISMILIHRTSSNYGNSEFIRAFIDNHGRHLSTVISRNPRR